MDLLHFEWKWDAHLLGRFGLQHHLSAVGFARGKQSVPAYTIRSPQIGTPSETGTPLVDDSGQLCGERRHDGPLLCHAQAVPTEDENL